MVSDNIEFRHHKFTVLSVTPEDKVINGVQQLTAALKNTPAYTLDAQLQAIKPPPGIPFITGQGIQKNL